jgi:hypothetical protein
MCEVLIPNDQYSRRQAGNQRIRAFNPFDDQCAGRAADHLRLAEAVPMRVVPIPTRPRAIRNLNAVLESRRTRLHARF